jgi:amino acid adenylation domain-containing protein
MFPVQRLECNQTEVDYPRESTVHELFMEQAARTPEATAVIAGDCRLSYRQLDELSNRLARHLQSLGVKPETMVGIAMERSETLIVGLLAILKAGGSYVPLDPSYPKERLSWIIEDSGMPALLTTASTFERLPSVSAHLAVVDVRDSSIALHPGQAVSSGAKSSNLAYVIYTSGSTGKPKGVMVEHRNVVNFFTGMDRAIGCEPGVWLAVTSVSFDISVLELLWTLTRGSTVVVHGDEGYSTIADELVRHRVTHLQMTPSLARILTLDTRAFARLASLRQMLLGGEAVPASLIYHLRRVFKGEIFNMYGPTETTIWSTTCRVEEVNQTVPIGRPIANTQVYVLDERLNPALPGEAGELFIGGDGVARGYWNRTDLTAERFLAFPPLSGQRIYRTGDLARFLPDGGLEFLGRTDFQIKLRGHRIELAEIEAVIEECPGIRQAVVVVREDKEGDKRLVAYLTADAAEALTPPALRSALDARLPDFMVPSACVFLEEMPLTNNGKIDRKALLQLGAPNFAESIETARAGNSPTNEIEYVIARVWQEALGLPAVGMDQNFFDLGAHSLTVAEVHAKLQEALAREIPLLDLFQFTTVSALAGHLAGTDSRGQLSDRAQRRRMALQH